MRYKRHKWVRQCSEVRKQISWEGWHFGASDLQVMTWPHFFVPAHYLWEMGWKIVKCIGTRVSAQHPTFHVLRKSRRMAMFLMLSTSELKEVSQKSFVFQFFSAFNFQTWRKSRTRASFSISFQSCRYTDLLFHLGAFDFQNGRFGNQVFNQILEEGLRISIFCHTFLRGNELTFSYFTLGRSISKTAVLEIKFSIKYWKGLRISISNIHILSHFPEGEYAYVLLFHLRAFYFRNGRFWNQALQQGLEAATA